jgi:Zn-dependent protease with chaperone function
LANLANSREYELEADDDAVLLLGAVGSRPEALASALEKLKRAAGAKGVPDFFSTHPDPDARIERLKRGTLPRMGVPREWPSEQQWRALKAKVGPHRDGR